MDIYCKNIKRHIGTLGNNLDQIVESTGFARQTVSIHLKHLIDDNQIVRIEQITKHKKGRPRVYYRKTKENPESDDNPKLEIAFWKVKSICKNTVKEGRFCRRTNSECHQDGCFVFSDR